MYTENAVNTAPVKRLRRRRVTVRSRQYGEIIRTGVSSCRPVVAVVLRKARQINFCSRLPKRRVKAFRPFGKHSRVLSRANVESIIRRVVNYKT